MSSRSRPISRARWPRRSTWRWGRRPQTLAARPTTSPEAHDLYLRANQYFSHEDRATVRSRSDLYQRAVALDSGLRSRVGELGASPCLSVLAGLDPSPERLALAQAAAERAARLEPDLPEGSSGDGVLSLLGSSRLRPCAEGIRLHREEQPNNADVIEAIGLVQRRQGRWQESLASLKRAVELDPLSTGNLIELGETYSLVRDYPNAERVLDRAITIAPNLPSAYGDKMRPYMNWDGHVDQVRGRDARCPEPCHFGALIADAGTRGGLRLAADSAYRAELGALSPAALARIRSAISAQSVAYRLRGDAARSRAYYDSVAGAARAELKDKPDEAFTHGALGLAEAYRGNRDQAIREGRRAVELMPLSKDALEATFAIRDLAEIYMAVGEANAAIDQLQGMIAVPSYASPAGIKADPTWAPLRGNPRFERLVAGK